MAICKNPSCGKEVKVTRHGFCNSCYHRLRRNGTLDYKNPGSMTGRYDRQLGETNMDHPLYRNWRFLRSKYAEDMDPRWAEFKNFVADVPSRPTDRSFFNKSDQSLPYGPHNFQWREPLLSQVFDMTTAEGRAAYSKEYRKTLQYDRTRRYKIKYGITMEQYEAMYTLQEGKCAMCGEFHEQLLVDHDHATNEVRELLCNGCNSG